MGFIFNDFSYFYSAGLTEGFNWKPIKQFWFFSFCLGSGTESDSDDSVPELEEQDSAQTQTQQAQVDFEPLPSDLSRDMK